MHIGKKSKKKSSSEVPDLVPVPVGLSLMQQLMMFKQKVAAGTHTTVCYRCIFIYTDKCIFSQIRMHMYVHL
jgi:hypothetical protein